MGNGNEVGVVRMRDNREYNKGAGRRERGRREKGGGDRREGKGKREGKGRG